MADDLTFALWLWVNDVIAYTLMRAFLVIMNYKLFSTISKVLLTKDNHLVQTFGFDSPDESLYEGGHIRT